MDRNVGNDKNRKRTQRNRSSAPRNKTPEKQIGGFQVFNLKEVRAEEKEAEERIKALEREKEEKRAEELQRKLEQMESSYAKNVQAVKKTKAKPVKKPAAVEKPSSQTWKRTKAAVKPMVKKKEVAKPNFKSASSYVPPVTPSPDSIARREFLNKTIDSSKNFSSVHTYAQKIHGENAAKRQAPKAELQGMDEFWAEMEAAKKREAEERRQREIERARQAELEKARAHEAVLARLREEETQKRREEEAERQRNLEMKRQNEEAAAKWRAEEAARVRAEADRMREIQIQKAKEEEARRIQLAEVAKVREAQIQQVRMEEEEKIRENLARMMNEEDQQAQIENMLEQEILKFQEEGALLKEKDELDQIPEETNEYDLPVEKEPDLFDDFSFPDVPSMEEDDVSLELNEEEDTLFLELNEVEGEPDNDYINNPKSWVRTVISKEIDPIVSDEELFDPIEGIEEEKDSEEAAYSDDEEDSDVEFFDEDDGPDSEDFDSDDNEESDVEFFDEEDDMNDEDIVSVNDEEDDLDDFDEEIVSARQSKKSKRAVSKSFVLPSFDKIMDSERPRESRKERLSGNRIEEHSELVQQDIQEKVSKDSAEEETPVINDTVVDLSEVDVLTDETTVIDDTIDDLSAVDVLAKEITDTEDTAEVTPNPVASEVKSVYRKTVDRQYHYNRKTYDSVLGKIVAAGLIGIMALNLVLPDKATSVMENRELKQAPKFSISSVLDGSFTGNVEEWQGDQFAGRNILRSIQIFLRWIGGDREENDVYFGKDGQLLEKVVKPEEELLQNNINALNAFASKYPDRRYGMMLVPDAATILTDQYPAFVEKREQRGDFGRVKNMLSEQFQWVDVLASMDTHPGEKLYYKTDHHWTSLGAYYGYQNFCATFGMDPGSFTSNTVTSDFNGSLSSMSGFCLGEKETIEIYLPDAQTKELVTYVEENRQTATLYDKEKLDSKDQYALFMGGNAPLIDIRTTTDNDQVLMLVKDSFANSMIPFLTTQYKEIIVVDPRYYYGDAEELLLTYGVSDLLILYSGNTFFADNNLQGFFGQEIV